MSQSKKAYFQGGGGVNEPTPGKKKYKSDPALVMQPRFKEPFYRNYDLYTIPGMEEVGPGTGWHGLQNYKSVQEFLQDRRERLKPRYVSDDSWQLDNGSRTKKNPNITARAALLSRLVKTAGDDNDGPNFDYGDGAYTAMSEGKKMKSITDHKSKGPGAFFADDNDDHMMPPKEHGTEIYDWKNSPYQGTPKKPKKHDSNDIDFPIDDQIDSPILGDSGTYSDSVPIGGQLDEYLPLSDFEGKSPDELDFGRDYTEDEQTGDLKDIDLEALIEKYLKPAEPHLYGLPDGISPPEDLDAPSNENPWYGETDSGNTLYDKMWI